MKRGAFAQGRSRLIGGLGRGRALAFRIVALGGPWLDPVTDHRQTQ